MKRCPHCGKEPTFTVAYPELDSFVYTKVVERLGNLYHDLARRPERAVPNVFFASPNIYHGYKAGLTSLTRLVFKGIDVPFDKPTPNAPLAFKAAMIHLDETMTGWAVRYE